MQSEPDASSYPSGGTGARSKPGLQHGIPRAAFIIKKGGTLSAYLRSSSHTTEHQLDLRLPPPFGGSGPSRAQDAQAVRKQGVRYVRTHRRRTKIFLLATSVPERTDIRFCGRTFWDPRPKGQKMEDITFDPEGVLAYMEDVQRDLARLGVGLATRHNEWQVPFERPILRRRTLPVTRTSLSWRL